MNGESTSSQFERDYARQALLREEELLVNKIMTKLKQRLQEVSKRENNKPTSEEEKVLKKQNDQIVDRVQLIQAVTKFDEDWKGHHPTQLSEVLQPYTDHILKLIWFYKQLQKLQQLHKGEDFEGLRSRYPHAISSNVRQAYLRTELIERALFLLNPDFDLGGGTLPLRFIKISRVIDECATKGPKNVSEDVLKKKEETEVNFHLEKKSSDKPEAESKANKALRTFLEILSKESPNLVIGDNLDVSRCVSEIAKMGFPPEPNVQQ